ncbi:MAG: hypothetical protein GVY31_02085 [Alphaproteobacteria bacterium]|jgi:hypothetical protein|nr:hypothetical protein [Alphaproteobacteria bacterium]
MRFFKLVLPLCLCCSGALAQFTLDAQESQSTPVFPELDGELFRLANALDEARLALLCSGAWDGSYRVDGTAFSDLAYERLAFFVSLGRDAEFQLPEYSEGLTPYLVEAVDAPNADIAVGLIFAEFRAHAEATLRAHQDAIDEVAVHETFEWATRGLDAGRIYRCEDLAPLLGSADGE